MDQPESSPEAVRNDVIFRQAVARAANALDRRIFMLAHESIPQAAERRNYGVVSVLEESLANDRSALANLQSWLAHPNP